jgi:hypothetical protein
MENENVEVTGGVSQGDYDWDCGGYNHSCSCRDCGRLRVSRRCCAFLCFIVAGVIAIPIVYMLTRHRTSPVKYVLIFSIILLL